MQTVPEKTIEDAENVGGAWEVEEEDWAMVLVMDTVESLNPTYEEAKGDSDWPKWKEAIQTEL